MSGRAVSRNVDKTLGWSFYNCLHENNCKKNSEINIPMAQDHNTHIHKHKHNLPSA